MYTTKYLENSFFFDSLIWIRAYKCSLTLILSIWTIWSMFIRINIDNNVYSLYKYEMKVTCRPCQHFPGIIGYYFCQWFIGENANVLFYWLAVLDFENPCFRLGVLIQISDMMILDGILRIYPSYKKILENILVMKILRIKGSSNTIHFIFEINVGKSRIRHRTTLDFEC